LFIFLAEKPLKEAPKKKISVKQESTDKLENNEKKNRYILFVGKLKRLSFKRVKVTSHLRGSLSGSSEKKFVRALVSIKA